MDIYTCFMTAQAFLYITSASLQHLSEHSYDSSLFIPPFLSLFQEDLLNSWRQWGQLTCGSFEASWDLEFSHSTLPNVHYVGGLHCKPARSLPKASMFLFALLILHFIENALSVYILHFWIIGSKSYEKWNKVACQLEAHVFLCNHKYPDYVFEI